MSLSKKNIKTGDIIVIQNKDAIKAILLKTKCHITHAGSSQQDAEKTAFNLINAEGEYNDGMQSIHGANDRLRASY